VPVPPVIRMDWSQISTDCFMNIRRFTDACLDQ
jgi:hypothetical protein